MSDIAIKVEGLGKQYRLGEIGTGTISHDLNRWIARLRGKEDPFAKVGETNDRTVKGNSDYVWSLKDIDFEVKKGEVLGIIGRNGAGKSTLLKILSKVTAPTTGNIKVNGRIASLLEVGTGFHPELTGRENIFLNGAILGMTKAEIRSKFDEIVDFSGVERYIDTPVKRYSSGMYVRLAFAVAAFLEPEILIVDEVLAVGDTEFQKKCIGRMKDVSVNDGRTVLFVSHNMSAIKSLCNTGLVLKQGMVASRGTVDEAIGEYYRVMSSAVNKVESLQKHNSDYIDLYDVYLKNYFEQPDAIQFDNPLVIVIKGRAKTKLRNVSFAMCITNFDNVELCTIRSVDEQVVVDLDKDFEVEIVVKHNIRAGTYIVSVGIDSQSQNVYFNPNVFQLDILEVGNREYKYKNNGVIDVESAWNVSV
jgi:ABC-type polysaccharide/polyol phosphate transport system ATPase subunit